VKLGYGKAKEDYKPTHFTDLASKSHKKNSIAVGKYSYNVSNIANLPAAPGNVVVYTKPKYRTAYMGKKPESVEPWRIKKDSEPGPGSYQAEECIRKTKWKNDVPCHKWEDKRENFTDTVAKRKKFVPAVGHYKNMISGETGNKNMLCKSVLLKPNTERIEA